jgi:hypothetical protein
MSSALVVVGGNGKYQRDDQGDQTQSGDRSDTESGVEDTTPCVGIEQGRPPTRLEIHALKGEMNESGAAQNDERRENECTEPSSIDDGTHEESQSSQRDHQREERDPAHDHQRRVDALGARTPGEDPSDQLAHVDRAGVDRSDRERERALHEMSVARHHAPGHDVDPVGERRETGEFDRVGRLTRRDRSAANRLTRRVEDLNRIDGGRHRFGEVEADDVGRRLEDGRW